MNECNLPMGPEEIAVEYKNAADQKKQIKILAELNCTTREQIIDVLESQGLKVDKRWFRQKPEAKPKPEPEPKRTEEPEEKEKSEEPASTEPAWITTGMLQSALGWIPGDIPIVVNGTRITQYAFVTGFNAETRETKSVLELR